MSLLPNRDVQPPEIDLARGWVGEPSARRAHALYADTDLNVQPGSLVTHAVLEEPANVSGTVGVEQTAFARNINAPWWIAALSRRRVQLLGAVLISVLAPALFRWPSPGAGFGVGGLALDDAGIANGVFGSGAAILLGFILFCQIKTHPSVNSVGYVFYAFGMAYGGLAILLLLLRADYSRFELGASFLLAVGWFAIVDYILGHRVVRRMAVIPSHNLAQLPCVPNVDWLRLREPDIDVGSVSGIVADLRAPHEAAWERLMARCALAAVPVYDVRHITEQITGRMEITCLSDNSLPATLHSLIYGRLKRVVDLVLVLFVAPVLLLVIGLAMIAIRLDDKGPAIFRQVRMGHRGRPFTMYKLRTMRSEATNGDDFTTVSDPRVTRLGRFLRKYRIDELPQIWNILRGEMSWIGPRPETIKLSEWYERDVPYYCYRHMVRPGISGWAQVNQGNVAQIDAATEKLQYDFYYIKHLSPWLDLLIVAKTLRTISTGFGAL